MAGPSAGADGAAAGAGEVGALRALYEEVAAYPLPEPVAGGPEADADAPYPYFALPLRIEHDGRLLSFVSSVSTFNTPLDVTVAELAIETLLPGGPGDGRVPPVTRVAPGGVSPEAVVRRPPSHGRNRDGPALTAGRRAGGPGGRGRV